MRALARSRQALVLDNLALRHQLATVAHRGRRPRLLPTNRLFWVALRALWTDRARSLVIVKPATVVAWHRRAYRAYWCRIWRQPGRPRTDAQLRDPRTPLRRGSPSSCAQRSRSTERRGIY